MTENPNCIVKAFENTDISIFHENSDDKKTFYFKASDIGKILDIVNIRTTIQNFDDDEKVVRKAYDLRGAEQDTTFLTSQGVYRVLYNSKKDISKKFRKWVGNILDDIIFNQSNELKKKLQEVEDKNKQLVCENTIKTNKLELLTKKTNKYEPGQSVYIFHSTITQDELTGSSSTSKVSNNNINIYKIGRTKNANDREYTHKTSSFKGILLQVPCVDSSLLERYVHFLLHKYRIANNREWFHITYKEMENAIYYAKTVMECDLDFKNNNLVSDFKQTIEKFETNKQNDINKQHEPNNIDESNEADVGTVIFSKYVYIPKKSITDYQCFLNECCEEHEYGDVSFKALQHQYKIWSKSAHRNLKDLIIYVKTKYKVIEKRHNPLVSTSKMTDYFKGIRIKSEYYEFKKPINDRYIIEKFLYEHCLRNPCYRASIKDVNKEFEEFYENEYSKDSKDDTEKVSFVMKEQIKDYFDNLFIRLRTGLPGAEANGQDKRLSGWLGFALKSSQTPEPELHYNPKNMKKVNQIRTDTQEIIKTWPSITELSDYLKKSTTVTSGIVKRHEQIPINDIYYVFEAF